MADLDPFTIAVLGVSAGLVLLMIQNTMRFQNSLTKESRQLEGMLTSLEGQAMQIKSDVQDLQRVLETKTDHSYLDKRIDGLVQLIKAR